MQIIFRFFVNFYDFRPSYPLFAPLSQSIPKARREPVWHLYGLSFLFGVG